MVLHAIGDTIGYKNGKWEFMQGDLETKALEKLYEFIHLGGINHLDITGWSVSDDTVLHLATARGLLAEFKNMNQLAKHVQEQFIAAYEQFMDEGIDVRAPGKTTMTTISRLKEGGKWDDLPYNVAYGGAGASMRTCCIGLAYDWTQDLGMLMQVSIETSRMTHNSAVGYLGGFTSALFTSMAIGGLDIRQWPHELVRILESGDVEKYLEKSGRGLENYANDHHVFIDKWKRYIEDKFDDDGNPIQRRTTRNIPWRGTYYCKNFSYVYRSAAPPCTKSHAVFIGSGGDDSVIIAYDCLLDSGDNWEKLVIYSMLHGGDADTTGCIAGGWFGTLYGMAKVPGHYRQTLEYGDDIEKVGEQLWGKYAKKLK